MRGYIVCLCIIDQYEGSNPSSISQIKRKSFTMLFFSLLLFRSHRYATIKVNTLLRYNIGIIIHRQFVHSVRKTSKKKYCDAVGWRLVVSLRFVQRRPLTSVVDVDSNIVTRKSFWCFFTLFSIRFVPYFHRIFLPR